MPRIDEKTLMPLSFVGGFVAIGIWVGMVQSDGRANADDIRDLKAVEKTVNEMNGRVSEIKGKVDVIYDAVRDLKRRQDQQALPPAR